MSDDPDVGQLLEDVENRRKRKTTPGKQRSSSSKEIVIRVNALMLERVTYWAVIAVLVVMLFVNPLNVSTLGETTTTQSAADPEPVDPPVTTSSSDPEPDSEPSNPVPSGTLSNRIEFEIIEVIKKETEYGGKVESVKLRIDNQKADFLPVLEMNIWSEGENAIEVFKNRPIKLYKGTRQYDSYVFDNELKVRTQGTFEVYVAPLGFQNGEDAVVKVTLYDTTIDEENKIKSVSKRITI